MKLIKALRLKNKIVNELKHLERTINDNNSYIKKNIPLWNVRELMEERSRLKTRLIDLKDKISVANISIVNEIHLMEETKGDISFLKNINTKEGIYRDSGFGVDSSYEEEYISTFNQREITELIKEKLEKLELIQDKLNEFNYKTEIDFY